MDLAAAHSPALVAAAAAAAAGHSQQAAAAAAVMEAAAVASVPVAHSLASVSDQDMHQSADLHQLQVSYTTD